MKFGAILRTLGQFCEEREIRWALIGGLGLAAYGLARTTLDLDLVVDGRGQSELVAKMEALGFETLHRSRGYSNHAHPDPSEGRVDFVYVRGETAEKLFGQTVRKEGPEGVPVRVPKPEHLAALKVLAMKNDPSRVFQEMADIRFLLELPDTNREEVRRHFERHGLADRYREIEETL